MSCGFRRILGRAVCLLTALGLLAATAPGCGGETPKTNAQVLQKDDNSAMLNFMKSQQQKKK
jgi:hypothetical protein